MLVSISSVSKGGSDALPGHVTAVYFDFNPSKNE